MPSFRRASNSAYDWTTGGTEARQQQKEVRHNPVYENDADREFAEATDYMHIAALLNDGTNLNEPIENSLYDDLPVSAMSQVGRLSTLNLI